MSFDRQFGKIFFVCNICDEYYETDEGNMSLATRFAKRDGWSIFRDTEDEWVHLCPECSECQ